MTASGYGELKRVFQQALEYPASERHDWLRSATGGDERLFRQAEALLQAYETAGDFLEHPPTITPEDIADDQPLENDAALPPGTHVGPYEIRGELGRGGMGIVYLAEDRRLGRAVALKSFTAVSGREILRERLRREARAAAAVTHPSIATVYALEEYDGQLFIASEYVPGPTLREALVNGPLERGRARAVALDIARALAAAHAAGVVHRDLKPENIVISDAGLKVIDFGIARMDDDVPRLTRDGALLGTPAYMAPEQLAGGEAGPAADVYAFGVIYFEMLTGRHPVQGPAPGAIIPAAVGRSLQLNPAERFASGRDLLEALERNSLDQASSPAAPNRWWWEFHQVMAAVVYWLMVVPGWHARASIGGLPGRIFFVALLAAVIVAANLRLNLWFTSRFHPAELRWARRRAQPWIRTADWVFSGTLLAAGVLIGADESIVAVLCFSVSIGAALAFLFMEPATARAAFRVTS